jgi:chromate transporter
MVPDRPEAEKAPASEAAVDRPVEPGRASLASFAAFALWMGLVGFGGGWAVSQRIKRAVVHDNKWISEAAFVQTFAVSSALPGTTATNLLTMLGAGLAGLPGAVLGMLGFVTPSALLMIAFGASYARVRGIHVLAEFLDGMSFSTVGVVAAVAVDLRRSAVKTPLGYAIAVLALAAIAIQLLHLLAVILIAGLTGALLLRDPPGPSDEGGPEPDPPSPPPSRVTLALLPPLLLAGGLSMSLLFVFARIGVATFGGGFAMIPSIEHEVVGVNGWLDAPAFNDAMVLGQVTPGPVAIAATFIGYKVAGLSGAVAATLGVFGPPCVIAIIAARSLRAFRSSRSVQAFLRGVAPAVVGVIAAAAVSLWRTSVHGTFGACVAVVAFAALVRYPKLTPLLPLAAGGLVTAALNR